MIDLAIIVINYKIWMVNGRVIDFILNFGIHYMLSLLSMYWL